MNYHIESRTLTAQDTAVIRAGMPAAAVPAWIAGVYEEVHRYLTDRGIRADGPPFARYAFRGDVVDVEAGFPVLQPVPDGGRVTASRLPGGRAAVVTHYGRYEDLALACQAVTGWLKEGRSKPPGRAGRCTTRIPPRNRIPPRGAPTSCRRTGRRGRPRARRGSGPRPTVGRGRRRRF